MNWHAIWAIIEKDLKIVLQSKSVTIPLVTVPLLVAVVLPSVLGFVMHSAGMLGQIDVQRLLAVLPDDFQQEAADLRLSGRPKLGLQLRENSVIQLQQPMKCIIRVPTTKPLQVMSDLFPERVHVRDAAERRAQPRRATDARFHRPGPVPGRTGG